MTERVVHCWTRHADWIAERFGFHSDEHLATYSDDFRDGTCMLMDGHEGPHEFVDDEEIVVEFGA